MTARDFNYERNNIGYDFQCPLEKGGGIKCKNHEICESILPLWWFECKGNYLCTNCDMFFNTGICDMYNYNDGILRTSDNIECPVCLENKIRGVSFVKCNHFICIDCFQRCVYGDDSNFPIFPYPDIEDQYYNDTSNPVWETNYPLIKIYNEETEMWEENKWVKYENEKNLRKCPVCRS